MTWQERRIVTFLSAVLVVLSAIVLVLLGARYKENRAENEAALGIGSTAPATDPGAYTALSYENGSFTLSFSLDENGNWVWADDPSFPLDNTTILAAGKMGIEVACGDGKSLCITELQAEGGKRMAASAYLLGHPIQI